MNLTDFVVCDLDVGNVGVFRAGSAKDAALEACMEWDINDAGGKLHVVGLENMTAFDLVVVPQHAGDSK